MVSSCRQLQWRLIWLICCVYQRPLEELKHPWSRAVVGRLPIWQAACSAQLDHLAHEIGRELSCPRQAKDPVELSKRLHRYLRAKPRAFICAMLCHRWRHTAEML